MSKTDIIFVCLLGGWGATMLTMYWFALVKEHTEALRKEEEEKRVQERPVIIRGDALRSRPRE